MATDSVTLVTRLNRINHRRILIYIGNGNGLISYAKGKGEDYEEAYMQAFRRLKENMIAIEYDQLFTCPQVLFHRHNDFRLWLYPRSKAEYWGSPHMWHLLVYAGIFHCRFVIKSRDRNRYSMIYALFGALSRNKTAQQYAEAMGKKFYQVSYGVPTAKNGLYMVR